MCGGVEIAEYEAENNPHSESQIQRPEASTLLRRSEGLAHMVMSDNTERRGLERRDVFNIDLANLRVSVHTVLVNSAANVPTGELAHYADDASSAVLAVVAVEHQWVVASVQDVSENALHGGIRDGLLLSALHGDHDVVDSIGSHEASKFAVAFLFDRKCARNVRGEQRVSGEVTYISVFSLRVWIYA